MTQQSPPIYEKVVNDEVKMTLPWILFMNQMFDGDVGASWTPNFVNLTTVGTPTVSSKYYKLSKYLTFFRITITPATSTTSTAGTTYIDNYPIDFKSDGVVFAVSGGLGGSPGHIIGSSNRIYVPAWSAVTVPLTLIGIAEAT